ncbi:ragulator complex protein LAMTOR3 isoform X2 [Petaurus breviceps papuanus]|uniref:ragulator complex protein LAMTOR3 isoform X2 n=1 Tax=Petaurus breviceps papuanus TaxID=3040969 RepID=UPI0036D8497C
MRSTLPAEQGKEKRAGSLSWQETRGPGSRFRSPNPFPGSSVSRGQGSDRASGESGRGRQSCDSGFKRKRLTRSELPEAEDRTLATSAARARCGERPRGRKGAHHGG